MAEVIPEDTKAKYLRILFTPCDNQAALSRWIQFFLGIELPDSMVDTSSTGTPMGTLWEIYSAARTNRPDFKRVLCYASRGTFKTLIAAIMEVLCVCHLERDVCHMAAVQRQSTKAQSYVKHFFNRPYLRNYKVGDNVERVEIVRYYQEETGVNLSLSEYKALLNTEKDAYVEIKRYIELIVCTMQAVNGPHTPFVVVDELDVIPKDKLRAYEDAKLIADPRDGHIPITMLISTRKFNFALVQREIDEAAETGLIVRHWNLIDGTEVCPPSRHLPELPKIPIYHSEHTLKAFSQEQYDAMNHDDKAGYVKTEGFQGCLSNCSLFAMCKTRLATHQKSTSPMLKSIDWTTGQFKTVSLPVAKAQLLCWKPSSEGLIYATFDRDVHMLTAAEMATEITGEPSAEDFNKKDLQAMMLDRGMQFYGGVDFGFTHNFSVVVGAKDGNRMFITDCYSQPELLADQRAELITRNCGHLDAIYYCDPEDPGAGKQLSLKGIRTRKWSKVAGSVLGGIDIVRMKLTPGVGIPQLYFLKDDPGVEFLCKRIGEYHWALDAAGLPSKEPDDTDDDENDALRYLVMNVFAPKGKVTASEDKPAPVHVSPSSTTLAANHANDSWMSKIIQEHLGEADSTIGVSGGIADEKLPEDSKGRKGSFIWDIG